MEPLKLHWASSKKNFGDWLSPALCQLLSNRAVEHASPERCELIAIGSILGRVGHGWFSRKTTIWGAGFIEDGPRVSSRHRYCAVRGKETARRLKRSQIDALGDPGLLCDLLVGDHATIPKQHALGVVPHYRDRGHAAVSTLAAHFPGAVILDVFTEPVELLRAMAGCEFILSSSLHGLIASDALGIPNAWVQIGGPLRGDHFKFRDYYSVFGLRDPQPMDLANGFAPPTILELRNSYRRLNLEEVKRDLLAVFPFPAPRAPGPFPALKRD